MFSNNFIVAIKVGGKVLRESGNLVTLPFGCEYTVLLKNLQSRRAMVKLSVDGKDATEGTRLIVQPNASLELERFIRQGNLVAGNRFKFIERSSAIEAHRGITEDDGIIRAEFWAEQVLRDEIVTRRHYYDEWYPRPYPRPVWPRPYELWCSSMNANYGGRVGTMNKMASASAASRPVPTRSIRSATSANVSGITVAGSQSNQQFHHAAGFPVEVQSHVIALQLRGEVAGAAVTQPVTVDRKPTCETCGKKNKPDAKFCVECGTGLVLV